MKGKNMTTQTVFDPKNLLPLCPSSYGYDNIPLLPSDILLKLFKELDTLESKYSLQIKEMGTENLIQLLPIKKQQIAICQQIKYKHAQDAALKRASDCGWPTRIDFWDLSNYIVAMKDLLEPLMSVQIKMVFCFV
jgi:hypothetical protein